MQIGKFIMYDKDLYYYNNELNKWTYNNGISRGLG